MTDTFDILSALNEIEGDVIPHEPEPDIETQALTIVDQARSVVIVDQGTYDQIGEILLANKDLQAVTVAHHAKAKADTYQAWQSVLEMERKVLDPLKAAEKVLKAKIGQWDADQRRIKAENERVAREAAEAERAKEVAQEVHEAQAAGAPAAEIQAIIEQPRPAPRPIVAPTYTRSKSLPVTPTYGCEVESIKDLCRAVADGVASTELVMGLKKDSETGIVTSPVLEQMAKTLKSTFQIAGCKLITGTSVSARRKGKA
jgi:hypothetical protein